MKYNELKRILIANGCFLEGQKANHEWWFSPQSGKHFPLQRHGNMDVGIGVLKSLEKQTGIKLR